ncbi:MAG: succinylglutamate desuccinylase/aspartoacylase family protein [Symbiobacteriaceae bacterium]|nr:succinylglutamate desuccinylase/aspartoacylase family protein [Symbiobacteriaceae bacterium]
MLKTTLKVDDIMGFTLDKYLFGEGEGPKLMITGGVHGGEVTGIHTCHLLIEWLKEQEAQLKGQVMIIPICNPPAFRRMQRTNPYDEVDMNRIFPGNMEGSPTHRAAAVVFNEAAWADYVVDLHCCGIYGSNYILAMISESEAVKELAMMLDIPVAVDGGGRTPGQLFVEVPRRYGKGAAIIELAGGQPMGKVDLDAVAEAYKAMQNLMRQLGMVADEAPYKPEPVVVRRIQRVQAPCDGYFEPAIPGGTWVKAGDLVGVFNGEAQVAATDCRVMNVGPARYLFKGGQFYNFVTKEQPPA